MKNMTPPTSVQYCKAIAGVVRAFIERKGYSLSFVSREALNKDSNGINSIMKWEGFGPSPTLEKIRKVEEYLRLNFSDDPKESESIYQGVFDSEMKKQRKSLR